MKYILTLALMIFMVGCSSKPVTFQFNGNNYYQIVNGIQIAFDGRDWYQLRHQDQSYGEINGQTIGVGEEWIKLTGENAGSHISTYHRDLTTYNNTNLPPVFIRY